MCTDSTGAEIGYVVACGSIRAALVASIDQYVFIYPVGELGGATLELKLYEMTDPCA